MAERVKHFVLSLAALLLALQVTSARPSAEGLPDPIKDILPSPGAKQEVAVLAGGCFWGVEAIFERLKGVSDVVAGFSGGTSWTANYAIVSLGITGHAEAVRITYNPAQITFGQLLKVYFSVAHDATQLNRQGPDEGKQYRSSIFYGSDAQKQVALAYIAQLTDAKVFTRPIVTTVVPLERFYAAEGYHQDFLQRHPTHPYIVAYDLPKLTRLKEEFPQLVRRD